MAEVTMKISRSDVVKMLIDGWTTSELKAVAFKFGISGGVPELRTQVKFALMTPTIKWRNADG
jgi:hypothetical protein